jgi:hypothetical protein
MSQALLGDGYAPFFHVLISNGRGDIGLHRLQGARQSLYEWRAQAPLHVGGSDLDQRHVPLSGDRSHDRREAHRGIAAPGDTRDLSAATIDQGGCFANGQSRHDELPLVVHEHVGWIGNEPIGIADMVAVPPVVRQDLAVAHLHEQFCRELVQFLLRDERRGPE